MDRHQFIEALASFTPSTKKQPNKKIPCHPSNTHRALVASSSGGEKGTLNSTHTFSDDTITSVDDTTLSFTPNVCKTEQETVSATTEQSGTKRRRRETEDVEKMTDTVITKKKPKYNTNYTFNSDFIYTLTSIIFEYLGCNDKNGLLYKIETVNWRTPEPFVKCIDISKQLNASYEDVCTLSSTPEVQYVKWNEVEINGKKPSDLRGFGGVYACNKDYLCVAGGFFRYGFCGNENLSKLKSIFLLNLNTKEWIKLPEDKCKLQLYDGMIGKGFITSSNVFHVMSGELKIESEYLWGDRSDNIIKNKKLAFERIDLNTHEMLEPLIYDEFTINFWKIVQYDAEDVYFMIGEKMCLIFDAKKQTFKKCVGFPVHPTHVIYVPQLDKLVAYRVQRKKYKHNRRKSGEDVFNVICAYYDKEKDAWINFPQFFGNIPIYEKTSLVNKTSSHHLEQYTYAFRKGHEAVLDESKKGSFCEYLPTGSRMYEYNGALVSFVDMKSNEKENDLYGRVFIGFINKKTDENGQMIENIEWYPTKPGIENDEMHNYVFLM